MMEGNLSLATLEVLGEQQNFFELVLDSRNSQSFQKPATNSLPLSFYVKHDFQLVGQRGIIGTIKINSSFAERLSVATTI